MSAIINNNTMGHYTKNFLDIKNLEVPGEGKKYTYFGQHAALVDEPPQSVKDFFSNKMSQDRVPAKNRYPLISYMSALDLEVSTREEYVKCRNHKLGHSG